MFDSGDGTCIEMFAGGKPAVISEDTAGSFVHFAFGVENPDEWYERALSCGATEKRPPCDMFLETSADPLDIRVAFVYGPVSYTHLDVYKRQGVNRVCAEAKRMPKGILFQPRGW